MIMDVMKYKKVSKIDLKTGREDVVILHLSYYSNKLMYEDNEGRFYPLIYPDEVYTLLEEKGGVKNDNKV